MSAPPPCPVTGEPAARLVQWVNARFLAELWRRALGVDVRPSFAGATRFGLWESPTGLYFFDPLREGDADFYRTLYSRMPRREYPRPGRPRGEFRIAAKAVRPGDRVLDVGCGFGGFRAEVPHARYLGLDPNFALEADADWARGESLAEHLRANAGAYDVAVSFQVMEHVADPVGMMRDMARAVRPGGRVIVGVPHVPSAATRIPNYLINATPHHLTWWTEAALRAAAARAGLTQVTVEPAPWTEVDAVVYWMERCSPIRCRGDAHYRHAWSWHAASLIGFLGALVMRRLRPRPSRPDDEGAALVMTGVRA